MSLAAAEAHAGNYERALELSLANAESCRPDPAAEITEAHVAAAHHNVGVLHRMRGDFDQAIANFERALLADPANTEPGDAIREIRAAEEAAAELAQADQAILLRTRVPSEAAPPTATGQWSGVDERDDELVLELRQAESGVVAGSWEYLSGSGSLEPKSSFAYPNLLLVFKDEFCAYEGRMVASGDQVSGTIVCSVLGRPLRSAVSLTRR